MLHTISIWLLGAGLLGAGVFNAIGTAATKSDFVRWGYPRWWGAVTGGLEILSAALIALPPARLVGLTLAAAIVAAAVATILRHRDYRHLAPLGFFAALIALAVSAS